jgi:uncharacterized membrane-anchored protein
MLLIKPGTKTEVLGLQDILGASHKSYRDSVLEDRNKRKERGIPMSDSIDWAKVKEAANEEDENIHLLVQAPIEDPGPYEPNPKLEGLKFKCEALSRRAVIAAQSSMSYDVDKRLDQMCQLLEDAKFQLVGVENEPNPKPEDLIQLGVIQECYTACMHVQSLDPELFGHSG